MTDIQTRKIEFVQEFLKLNDEKIISRFEQLIRKEKKAIEDFKPMSQRELNRRIDASMKDSENGRLIETDDLLEVIKEWK